MKQHRDIRIPTTANDWDVSWKQPDSLQARFTFLIFYTM